MSHLDSYFLSHAALFEFPATSTRAGVISAGGDFGLFPVGAFAFRFWLLWFGRGRAKVEPGFEKLFKILQEIVDTSGEGF